MEKDIQLGAEDKAYFKLEGGKLILGNQYSGKQVSAKVEVSGDLDQLGLLIKASIPGTVDDAIVDLIIAAMKGL